MIFGISDKEKTILLERINKAKSVPAPENSLGQWIGYIVDDGTSVMLEEIVGELRKQSGRNFDAIPKKGEKSIRLKNTLGQDKQIDHAIKEDKVLRLIVETKWLKDQRHLNDKGSWILMMGDILLENKNLKGVVCVLAGPWESMRTVIEKRAEAVIIPTQTVYDLLNKNKINIPLDLSRNAYKDPEGSLLKLLKEVERSAEDGIDFCRKIGYELLCNYKNDLKNKIQKLLLKNT